MRLTRRGLLAALAGGLLTPVAARASGLLLGSYLPPYPQSNLAFAYSFRRIVANYAGNVVDVVRISDSATTSIGLLANGSFDVATARAFQSTNVTIDLQTGASLLVSKWYDQTGNGNHLVQATTANQPLLLLGMFNGQPGMVFDSQRILNCPNNSAFDLIADQTIAEVYTMVDTDAYHAGTIDPTNIGWLIGGETGGKFGYFSRTKNAFSLANTVTNDMFQRGDIVTRTSGAVAFYLQGATDGTATGHGNAASGAQFSVGGSPQGAVKKNIGAKAELVGYGTAITASSINAIAADQRTVFGCKNPVLNPPPFQGAHALRFIASSYISAGVVLAYNFTQAWSLTSAVRMNSRPNPTSATFHYAMIIGNCGGGTPSFPGYEMWVDNSGFMRVRLINNYASRVMIGLLGSINLCDDTWHVVYATYDGSGTAAGVSMYVDGVQDTNTRIEYDALTSHSIVSAQPMVVGNQTDNAAAGFFTGSLDYVQIHNVARSSAYVAAHSGPGVLTAANDANVVLSYALNEGTGGAGATVADGSASGFTGTITGTPVWLS